MDSPNKVIFYDFWWSNSKQKQGLWGLKFPAKRFSSLFQKVVETTKSKRVYIRLRNESAYSLEELVFTMLRCYECCMTVSTSEELDVRLVVDVDDYVPLHRLRHITHIVSLSAEDSQEVLHGINEHRRAFSLPDLQFISLHSLGSQNSSTPSPPVGSVAHRWVPQNNRSCVGGTFDYLHEGHKVLLTATALLAKKSIVVGVSGDPLLKNKKHAEFMQPYDTRIRNVDDFIQEINPSLDRELFQLLDPFGPTITDPKIEVLVLSTENKVAITGINKKRKDASLATISHHVVPYLLDVEKVDGYMDKVETGDLGQDITENDAFRLSSTKIRSSKGKKATL